jgi:SAM-dependent methyltransferase
MVENVININDDFLNLKNYDIKNIDVCFLVDLAFQFAEPINYKSEIKILELIYQSLKNGGKIVLELDGCNKIIQNIKTTTKIWEEFGGDDPWRYSLWECDYKKNNNFLKWKKTYISKDLSKTDFSEIVLKLYTKKTIKDLLLKVGFKKIKFYNDWFGNKFINDKSEFIVVATK